MTATTPNIVAEKARRITKPAINAAPADVALVRDCRTYCLLADERQKVKAQIAKLRARAVKEAGLPAFMRSGRQEVKPEPMYLTGQPPGSIGHAFVVQHELERRLKAIRAEGIVSTESKFIDTRGTGEKIGVFVSAFAQMREKPINRRAEQLTIKRLQATKDYVTRLKRAPAYRKVDAESPASLPRLSSSLLHRMERLAVSIFRKEPRSTAGLLAKAEAAAKMISVFGRGDGVIEEADLVIALVNDVVKVLSKAK